ncbi:GPO family capsid scaffolding protein [Avibacterium paragallinarum]|nr:GPO family capsid scaffolding protein [Avibacterium paragallinarum]
MPEVMIETLQPKGRKMKNESKIKTGFICVATSGYSVDGRQITAAELHEMAESYDPELYTANLWLEHRRFMSFGQVLELKAEDQPNGETKLYAVIAPNQYLVNMNAEGQGLFSSVEIMPNFRNTGKAYLYGLGVTDSPASVGTTKLDFFKVNPNGSQFGEFVKMDFAIQKDNEEDRMKRGFLGALKEFFSSSAQSNEQTHSENNNNKEEISMTEEQLAKFGAVIATAVASAFSAKQEPEKPAEPKAEQPKEAPAAENQGVTKEEFNQLLTSFQTLEQKFNALSQEATPVPNGVPVEGKQNVYSVNGYNIDLSKGF